MAQDDEGQIVTELCSAVELYQGAEGCRPIERRKTIP